MTQHTSNTDLIAALDGRFETSDSKEMFWLSLQSHSRQTVEILPELAQTIQHLTRQAHSDAPVFLRELFVQFIEERVNPKLHWKIHQTKTAALALKYRVSREPELY